MTKTLEDVRFTCDYDDTDYCIRWVSGDRTVFINVDIEGRIRIGRSTPTSSTIDVSTSVEALRPPEASEEIRHLRMDNARLRDEAFLAGRCAPEAAKTITMSDVRLMAGEGKLSAHDVLAAVNAHLRMHPAAAAPEAAKPDVVHHINGPYASPISGYGEYTPITVRASSAPEAGEAKPVAIYQGMATDDDPNNENLWMDVPQKTYDELKQRSDMRFRIVYTAPVSADAGLSQLRKLYEAAAHIELEAQNGRDYDEVEHADAIAQWQLAAWKLMPALLSQRPAVEAKEGLSDE